ncbi:MAG: TetR/AcrR family transcriptional regulator [Polyangiales bacterium]
MRSGLPSAPLAPRAARAAVKPSRVVRAAPKQPRATAKQVAVKVKGAAAAGNKRRTRRSATEARQRILEAAQQQLMQVGPEALRLTDLARELQVSHPAILHHFGSREGLVAAVVRHSLQGLSDQLIAALRGGTGTDRLELVEMVADVCGDGGLARLLAWLLLSGRDSKAMESRTELPLKQLADTAHMLRSRLGHPASYDDTLFEVQLLSIVLLGEAIFGAAVWGASGALEGREAAREFRRRLTRLLPP